jgi:hypothetical protein
MQAKHGILLLCLLAGFSQLKGQNKENSSRFRAGIHIGFVASDIPGMDNKDGDSDFHKLGFSFGGIVNTRLNDHNTLQLEINYIQKGSASPPDSGNINSYKFALQYIEVPFLIKHKLHINIHRKPNDRLELHGGFSVGRLVGFSNIDETNSATQVDLSKLNTTELSLLVGLAFSATPNLSFHLRYSNSLTPAIKHNAIPTYQLYNAFNNGNNLVFFFGAQYVFGKIPPSHLKEPDTNTPANP